MQCALATAREEAATEAVWRAQAAREEGGDRLAVQVEAHVADAVEMAAEPSHALTGAAVRLAEARVMHTRQVANLEVWEEQATEEEGARRAREKAAATEHWPDLERQPWAPAASLCRSHTWPRVPALGPPACKSSRTRAPSSSPGLGERTEPGGAGIRCCLWPGAGGVWAWSARVAWMA